jgi:hypothetical protein
MTSVRTSGDLGCLSRRGVEGGRGYEVFCCLFAFFSVAFFCDYFRGCRRRVAVGGVGDGETVSIPWSVQLGFVDTGVHSNGHPTT